MIRLVTLKNLFSLSVSKAVKRMITPSVRAEGGCDSLKEQDTSTTQSSADQEQLIMMKHEQEPWPVCPLCSLGCFHSAYGLTF